MIFATIKYSRDKLLSKIKVDLSVHSVNTGTNQAQIRNT